MTVPVWLLLDFAMDAGVLFGSIGVDRWSRILTALHAVLHGDRVHGTMGVLIASRA